MKTRHPHLPVAALLLGMLIGGLGNTLLGTHPHEPWLLLAWRYLAAVLIVAYWIPQIWAMPARIKLAAVFDVVSVITFVLALSTVSVAAATTIGAFSPILALAVNHVVGRSKMPAMAALPIALGMTATFLITAQNGHVEINPAGALLVVISVVLNTAGTLLNTWYGQHVSAMTRTAAANLAGAVLLAPILAVTYLGPDPAPLDWALIGTAVFIAAVSGTLAKALILYASKSLPAPLLLAGSSLALVTAAASGWLILGQSLNGWGIAGILVGAAGSVTLAYVGDKVTSGRR